MIPYSDFAGEIMEVGGLVRGFSVGDRVVACINPSFLFGITNTLTSDVAKVFGGLRDGVCLGNT